MNVSQSYQKAVVANKALESKKLSFDDYQHAVHKNWTAHYKRIGEPAPKWVAGLIAY